MTNVPTPASGGVVRVPLALALDPDLSASAKAVYLSLASWAFDDDPTMANATQGLLAAGMGVTRRTVARGIAELRTRGYVHRLSGGVYYLPVEF